MASWYWLSSEQISNRALVTGGAGFIGSHLCERLLKEDKEVICVDNFFTGTKDNIKPLLEKSLTGTLPWSLNPGFKKTVSYFKELI